MVFLLCRNTWVGAAVDPLSRVILLLFTFLCSQVKLDELCLSKVNKSNVPFHASFQNCKILLLYPFHSTGQFTAINNITFIYFFFFFLQQCHYHFLFQVREINVK